MGGGTRWATPQLNPGKLQKLAHLVRKCVGGFTTDAYSRRYQGSILHHTLPLCTHPTCACAHRHTYTHKVLPGSQLEVCFCSSLGTAHGFAWEKSTAQVITTPVGLYDSIALAYPAAS